MGKNQLPAVGYQNLPLKDDYFSFFRLSLGVNSSPNIQAEHLGFISIIVRHPAPERAVHCFQGTLMYLLPTLVLDPPPTNLAPPRPREQALVFMPGRLASMNYSQHGLHIPHGRRSRLKFEVLVLLSAPARMSVEWAAK